MRGLLGINRNVTIFGDMELLCGYSLGPRLRLYFGGSFLNQLVILIFSDKIHFSLKAPIATNAVCFFSSAEMFKKPLWQTVWTQIRLLGAVCTGFTLFASILNSSVMLGNYLQQTTFSDAFLAL